MTDRQRYISLKKFVRGLGIDVIEVRHPIIGGFYVNLPGKEVSNSIFKKTGHRFGFKKPVILVLFSKRHSYDSMSVVLIHELGHWVCKHGKINKNVIASERDAYIKGYKFVDRNRPDLTLPNYGTVAGRIFGRSVSKESRKKLMKKVDGIIGALVVLQLEKDLNK